MTRWDIINHFIKKNDYKNYLEIGYYKGWSFDAVECEYKTAVDPNPCKTLEQESWKYGHGTISSVDGNVYFNQSGKELIVKMISDDFFNVVEKDASWDIIFIDGLHEAEQVTKDIINCIKHLTLGGVIVLHDCNPPLYEHTTTGIDGCWTGDTYKAILKYKKDRFNDALYVVDTDWGVGVLSSEITVGEYQNPVKLGFDEALTSWEFFDKNRKELLNILSVEEFINKTK